MDTALQALLLQAHLDLHGGFPSIVEAMTTIRPEPLVHWHRGFTPLLPLE